MPATAPSQQPPAVTRPRHPLHAMTTYELAGHRRELERAIAWFGTQDPMPLARAGLQARLDAVLGEQDDRARIARA